MVRYNGGNHLAMAAGDMNRIVHFWRDLLGMRLVAGLGRTGYRHYFFQMPETDRPTPESDRIVYPGAGSELFHGKGRQ